MSFETHLLPLPIADKNFVVKNHIVSSSVLKKNPLGDSPIKHNFVLEPTKKGPWPLVLHLAGYFGNGSYSFNQKTMEENFSQTVIRLTEAGEIPKAVHVFVDAMTGVGGSQFINSDGCGDYSDYIQKELLPSLHKSFSLKKDSRFQCIIGSSSGGYGALHHGSLKDSPLGVMIAIAPDSAFETSLLPDMYKLAPYMSEYKDIKSIQSALRTGTLQKKKNFFQIMNALAMTLCYSPMEKNKLNFPIDEHTGELKKEIWKEILKKDPVEFLPERVKNLKNKLIYIDVGMYDDFSLYFGARRIRNSLESSKIPFEYSEFPGTHFGLSERKVEALKWLNNKWKN